MTFPTQFPRPGRDPDNDDVVLPTTRNTMEIQREANTIGAFRCRNCGQTYADCYCPDSTEDDYGF